MLNGHATLLGQKEKYQTTNEELVRIGSMLVEKYTQYIKIGIGKLYIKIGIDKAVYWKFSQSSKNSSINKRNRMISSHIV
jgi:hypothetical protein